MPQWSCSISHSVSLILKNEPLKPFLGNVECSAVHSDSLALDAGSVESTQLFRELRYPKSVRHLSFQWKVLDVHLLQLFHSNGNVVVDEQPLFDEGLTF